MYNTDKIFHFVIDSLDTYIVKKQIFFVNIRCSAVRNRVPNLIYFSHSGTMLLIKNVSLHINVRPYLYNMSVSTFSEIKRAAFLVHVSCTLSQYDYSLKKAKDISISQNSQSIQSQERRHTGSASGGNESYQYSEPGPQIVNLYALATW